ncbi:MAG TPA: roadblock/LC7 domain-containing protein [Mycobacteriales bacterium]|nr:roadblock/LC7 domain-containing protein [Mycobacteriales bacterium]
MTAGSTAPEQIGWLLDDLIARVPGLSHAVALSSDGLTLAATSALPSQRAAHLSAVTAGLSSLAQGAAEMFGGGGVLQTVVEMSAGYLLVAPIDERACLVALAQHTADLEQVGYEVTLLVERVGRVLAPARRDRA